MSDRTTGRILITGASSGIGRAIATRLAALGFGVLAGVRNDADGAAIRSNGLEPVPLDVTHPRDIASLAAALADEPLLGLVNNAGIAVTGPLEMVSIEAWRRQFEVNVIGLVGVTQALLPSLRRGKGRIVNIGSVAGRSALPGSAPYDSSKYAIEGISHALRMELVASGIAVSIVEPGAIATPLWRKTEDEADKLRSGATLEMLRIYSRLLENLRVEAKRSAASGIPAENVVRAVVHALTARRPKTRYVVGRDARFWLLLNALPDKWRDRLILSQLNK